MAEPIPLEPSRLERRGEFPPHDDTPQPRLTAEQARARAAQRLIDWLISHG